LEKLKIRDHMKETGIAADRLVGNIKIYLKKPGVGDELDSAGSE
jgi:hypothetical protein